MKDVEVPEYAQEFMEALHESDVTMVGALPESHLKSVYRECERDEDLKYVIVSNEAELPGILAGNYMAGKRGLMIMENSGIRQCCEAMTRFAYCHGMPLVIVMSYRGEWGEKNWWGHNHSQTMDGFLETMRIPYRFVRRIEDIKPRIENAFGHADASQWPVALIMTDECVEGGKK